MNLLPLCTATVCPTNSGLMVDARAQVFTTRLSPDAFIRSIRPIRRSSRYGPFLMLRALCVRPLPVLLGYFVDLPRRRPRTMYQLLFFFRLRVLVPSGRPHGETGGRPPDVRPSPPPSGWSMGFIATPRTFGRRPSQRERPALPERISSWSTLPTCPTVAVYSERT